MNDERDGKLLPGTFELLILKALALGPLHGWGVADRIQRLSGGVFDIQQGAIYPVLQRLKGRGLVKAQWAASDNNRRARFYQLTAAGERALEAEVNWWRRATGGIDRVLRAKVAEA